MPLPPLPLRRPRLTVAAAVAALAGLAPSHAGAQPYTEVQVTTAAVPDYEFDSARRGRLCATCNNGSGNARLAFTDKDGNLWVGAVDYTTGNFLPSDGRGTRVDTLTAPVPCFGNGPEWVSSKAGSQLVYTRFLDAGPWKPDGTLDCSASRPQIVVATQGAGGWSTAPLPDSLDRATPEGSLEDDDTDPRVNYVLANKDALYWRRLSAPTVEVEMPINDLTGGNSRRWVPGTRKVIFQGHLSTDPRLLDQVWLFDTDTGTREQLTTDPVTKAGGFMWKAPEFNNEYVFFTMANFRQEIWVYRNLAAPRGKRVWTVVKKIKAPKNPTDTTKSMFFWSPEPFVHNGRSYIFTQVSVSNKFFDKSIPTHIALSGVDPLRNDLRMLTNASSLPRVRLDPEFFITAQGPFIYYNRLVPATDNFPEGINDGVWRIDTQLGPPKN